jgi:3-phenylpropionate/cinnamic acid dioxygenase small subunit
MEEIEDTKGVIRIRKSKDRQHNGQKKRKKGQTTIYKTLHRRLKDRVTRTHVIPAREGVINK